MCRVILFMNTMARLYYILHNTISKLRGVKSQGTNILKRIKEKYNERINVIEYDIYIQCARFMLFARKLRMTNYKSSRGCNLTS